MDAYEAQELMSWPLGLEKKNLTSDQFKISSVQGRSYHRHAEACWFNLPKARYPMTLGAQPEPHDFTRATSILAPIWSERGDCACIWIRIERPCACHRPALYQ